MSPEEPELDVVLARALARLVPEGDSPLTWPEAIVWCVAILCVTFLVWRWWRAVWSVGDR